MIADGRRVVALAPVSLYSCGMRQILALLCPRGMRLLVDAHPERGDFYRSDHFSFER